MCRSEHVFTSDHPGINCKYWLANCTPFSDSDYRQLQDLLTRKLGYWTTGAHTMRFHLGSDGVISCVGYMNDGKPVDWEPIVIDGNFYLQLEGDSGELIIRFVDGKASKDWLYVPIVSEHTVIQGLVDRKLLELRHHWEDPSFRGRVWVWFLGEDPVSFRLIQKMFQKYMLIQYHSSFGITVAGLGFGLWEVKSGS